MTDNVNNPSHYQFSNGAQVVDITENLTFNLGNVVKYTARAGRKTVDPIEDLLKAKFYLEREILRLMPDYGLYDEPLPMPLWPESGRVWIDAEGDEWRWRPDSEFEAGWQYRTPQVTGWIPITGVPSDEYGPFKEKHG
jgi:hypothetical protein